MRNTVVFGAGQIGIMASRLLGAGYRVICYADNNINIQGKSINGIPVLSPEDSMQAEPNCFCLGVLDDERAAQMECQIREFGFTGEIIRPSDLQIFDPRAGMMRLLAEQIKERNIKGDVAEVGVFRGDFAMLLNGAFPDRTLHLFDTFTGFPAQDIEIEHARDFSKAQTGDFASTNQNTVYHRMLYPDSISLHKGYFPDTFDSCKDCTFAFVSLDADLYAPTAAALPLFWERMEKGGVIMVHDYNSTQFAGAGTAVREFCLKENIYPIPICDLHGSVLLFKL